MAEMAVDSVSVVSHQADVAALLPPIRRHILRSLENPDAATGLAKRLGLPRQKINCHLRELENAGLVELVEERQRRGCVERRVRITARAFVVSPEFLQGLSAEPEQIQDKFSSSYLVSTASRILRDVAVLRQRADSVDKKLATLTLETEVSFDSPLALKAFSEELAGELARLTTKYTNPRAANSRAFRIIVGSHPKITKTAEQAASEAMAHARLKSAARRAKPSKRTRAKKETRRRND